MIQQMGKSKIGQILQLKTEIPKSQIGRGFAQQIGKLAKQCRGLKQRGLLRRFHVFEFSRARFCGFADLLFKAPSNLRFRDFGFELQDLSNLRFPYLSESGMLMTLWKPGICS